MTAPATARSSRTASPVSACGTATGCSTSRRHSSADLAARGHGAEPGPAARRRPSRLAAGVRRGRVARAARASTCHDLADVRLRLPFTVADYVDFYSSEHHARNLGRILRPGQPELPPNWKHLPDRLPRPRRHRRGVGHRRRPARRAAPDAPEGEVVFGPTTRLDIEAEVGFVVGVPSRARHRGAARRLRRPRLRRLPGQRLVGAGHPGLGVPAARAVPRQVLRDLGGGRGSSRWPRWRRPGSRRPPRDPQPLPYLDDAGTAPRGPRPPPRGPAQRQPGVGAAVRPDVLDRRPAARPPDRQRGVAAHRRPVRVGHGQRPGARRARLARSSCPGTAPSRSSSRTAGRAPSWRTATRS